VEKEEITERQIEEEKECGWEVDRWTWGREKTLIFSEIPSP
jgi:hypothetical protein